MKIKTKSDDGIIYQIEREFDGIGPVTIDICYSGNQDEEGNDILEFVYASVEDTENDKLSLQQRAEANKALECGLEESVLLFLINEYQANPIEWKFDLGEYNENSYLQKQINQ
jgi:hypothetical protein